MTCNDPATVVEKVGAAGTINGAAEMDEGFGGPGRISGDADVSAPAPRQRGGRDRQPPPPSASGQEGAPARDRGCDGAAAIGAGL